MSLKPFDQANDDASSKYWDHLRDRTAVPSGVACPMCKTGEMLDNRSEILTSAPPRYNCVCAECGYRTTRICS